MWLWTTSNRIGICWRAINAQECFLTSRFSPTPAAQTAAAKWLRGFNYKEILFSMVWQNIFIFQQAVLPQYDFEDIMSGTVSWRANIAQVCFFTSMFPHTPAAQTTAAKWLRGFKWKEILFSRVWHNIFQFYWAVFRNMTLKISCPVGCIGVRISRKNASLYRCFQTRQLHKLLWANSCGVLIERQFCSL